MKTDNRLANIIYSFKCASVVVQCLSFCPGQGARYFYHEKTYQQNYRRQLHVGTIEKTQCVNKIQILFRFIFNQTLGLRHIFELMGFKFIKFIIY